MGTYNAAQWLLDRHIDAGDGERTAIRCDGSSTSYAELQRQAWRVQNALAALDARPGERVAMVVDDEVAFPAWFLGSLRSGLVPVALSTMLTAGDLAAIIDDAGAGVVVLSAPYRPHLDAIAGQVATLRHAVVLDDGDESLVGGVPVHAWSAFTDVSPRAAAQTIADSPAFWLYSSGTTGRPKGVMHRHAALQATADTYGRQVLQVGPDDRCLSVAKLFFAYGLGNSLTFPMSVGACAILNQRPPDPTGMVELVEQERPTLFFATPGFVAALLDAEPPVDAFASVRCTVTAGEALPADLQRRFSERFGHPVLDGIGSTEALHIFLSNTTDSLRPGTSGVAVPGYDLKLLDETDGEIVEPDVPGFLHVRGDSVATGYWSRYDATRAAFRGDWLRTGDVYTRSDDGFWTFLGRNNDMIKAGGIWVSPAEVEAVLVAHPDVLEAAVVGDRDETGLEQTVAFVVPRSGHEIDLGGLEKHCRSQMAAFKRPKRVIVVDTLPKTATGKIRRFALRDQLAARP